MATETKEVKVVKDYERPVVIKATAGNFLYETKVARDAENIQIKMGIYGHSYTHSSGRYIERWVFIIPDNRKQELNTVLGIEEAKDEVKDEVKEVRRGRPPSK